VKMSLLGISMENPGGELLVEVEGYKFLYI
jgi:hypothetical protein